MRGIVLVWWLGFAALLPAETFHVTTTGKDDPARNGTSLETAWASLAYACERVAEGKHTIQLGAGTFTATRTAIPKNGVTIQGMGATGKENTQLIASGEWAVTPTIGNEDDEAKNRNEYLIAVRPGKNLTVRALELCSPTDRLITGAFFVRDGKDIVLEDLHVHDFRWNGLRIEFSENIAVRRCTLHDCSSVKRGGSEGGHIRTRWLSNSRLHENRITSSTGKGYGYKGGGHVNVRLDHNFIDVGYFAVECAHENEFGVEIDHNYLTRCISVPKSGQSQDPAEKKQRYTFWIHDNLLTDSYTIEGPRNHMRISHNYIRIEKTGGRVYTHHGGINNGPVWLDHNLIENVDRAVVWMNGGLAENIYFVNNTVDCANAKDRADVLFSSYEAKRLHNWVIKNNLFMAPEEQPRKLFSQDRDVPTKITATNNMLVRVTHAPKGNVETKPIVAPRRKGTTNPWEFTIPAPAKGLGNLVDAGALLPKGFWGEELPFVGKAPDIGAVEYSDKVRAWDVPQPPKP